MRFAKSQSVKHFTECARAAAIVLLLAAACVAQGAPAVQPPNPFADDLKKYPGLAPELAQLTEDLKHDVRFPPPRRDSTILPLLPAGTNYYVGLPNYGEVARQSLATLNRHLQSSAVLREWWQANSFAPKMQEFLQKFAEISEYLGDEIVVFGDTGNKNRSFVILAQVRKPGLKDLLKEIWRQNHGAAPPLIFDVQELAAARPIAADQIPALVRPDYLVIARNLESLRDFNSFLDTRTKAGVSSVFGKRVQHAYEDGVSTILAADAQSILNQLKIADKRNQDLLERSGFSDMQYAIWQYRQENEKSGSIGELSFTGPRRGAAAWLALPGKMGGLDFISPQAAMVGGILLKNFAEIYADIQSLASVSNPQAFAAVTPMERMLNISLKDDLFALFSGEIVWELQGLPEDKPEWKVIARVSDAGHLQATLQKLATTMRWQTSQFEDSGTMYTSITMPSPQRPSRDSGAMPPTPQPAPMVYTMIDGYLVVASGRESAIEAVRVHKSGQSLAKSNKLQMALPAGYSTDASALFYEDPSIVMANNLRRLSPDMAQVFTKMSSARSPVIFHAYGEETAIRSTSSTDLGDPSALLVVAAIAIPNLLRARIAANDSSAVAALRTISVAQVTYRGAYPDKGFARDLASLGPDPRGPAFTSAEHGGMLDATLGGSTCAGSAWCQKSGYKFNLAAVCKSRAAPCGGFVVTATPVSAAVGTRNFCLTSDAIVRFKLGAPLTDPVTMSECRQWPALPK